MNYDSYHHSGRSEYDSDDAEGAVFGEELHPPRGYWHKIGGGSLTISITLHVLFAVVAIFLIWWQASPGAVPPPGEFGPGGGGGGGGENVSLSKRRRVTHAQPAVKLTSADKSATVLPNTSAELTRMQALAMLQVGGGGFGDLGTGDGRGDGDDPGVGRNSGRGWGIGNLPGLITIPPMLRSRCSPAERTQKMLENGGSDQCETAVRKTLKWLKAKQNKDGSWGETHKAGMTGLALLAYLGHCETPESPAYGETVLKGMTCLMELAERNNAPFDGVFSENPGVAKSTYEHGIATYAMGELYAFSKLGAKPVPGLRESFERGTLLIINKQAANGAWGYKDGIGYDPYGGNDLSVTGWQYQALKAAQHTGLKISGLQGAVKKVESYLESKQTADGGFGVASRSSHYNQWNLTGAALLGLQTLGAGNAGKINKGIRWLKDQIEKEPRTWSSDCYLYTWYYDTQALFQKGGVPWKVWNDQFQKEILTNQLEDGGYRAETVGEIAAAGAGAAAADRDIYRACLCTLMLEVYYRYLKVGDRSHNTTKSSLLPPG